jgi:predicted small secreted protein
MKIVKRVLLLLLAAISLVGTFTGCRTAHGFGEDMENLGDTIQDHT